MAIRWSPCELIRAALGASRHASDPEAIVPRRDAHAEGSQRIRHGLDAVRFLDAQLFRAPDSALAMRARGREREERQLVDQQRHLRGGRPPSRSARPSAPRDRRPARRRCACRWKIVMRAPMRASTSSSPMRRGLRPTSWIVSSDPGSSVAATTKGAAAEKSPGHVDLAEAQLLGRADRDAALLARHGHARRPRASARCGRGSAAARRRSCGRPRRGPRAGRTTSPARSPPAARSGSRAARRPRSRAAACRRRSRRPRPSAPAARRSGRRAAGGATRRPSARSGPAGRRGSRRAAAASCRSCRSRSAPSGSRSPRRPAPSTRSESTSSSCTVDAERAHSRDRRLGVARAAEAADRRLPFADRAEEDGAVRDRLVSGNGDVAAQRRGRLDLHSASTGETTTP